MKILRRLKRYESSDWIKGVVVILESRGFYGAIYVGGI